MTNMELKLVALRVAERLASVQRFDAPDRDAAVVDTAKAVYAWLRDGDHEAELGAPLGIAERIAGLERRVADFHERTRIVPDNAIGGSPI